MKAALEIASHRFLGTIVATRTRRAVLWLDQQPDAELATGVSGRIEFLADGPGGTRAVCLAGRRDVEGRTRVTIALVEPEAPDFPEALGGGAIDPEGSPTALLAAVMQRLIPALLAAPGRTEAASLLARAAQAIVGGDGASVALGHSDRSPVQAGVGLFRSLGAESFAAALASIPAARAAVGAGGVADLGASAIAALSFAPEFDLQSLLVAAMSAEGSSTLWVGTANSEATFGPSECAALEVLAHQGGLALEHGAFARREGRFEVLGTALHRLALELQGQPTPETVLEATCRAVRVHFDVDAAVARIPGRRGGIRTGADREGGDAGEVTIPSALAGAIAESVVWNDLPDDALERLLAPTERRGGRSPRGLLATRLPDADENPGVLALVDFSGTRRFSPDDLTSAAPFAELASSALTSVHLRDRVRRTRTLLAQQDRALLVGELAGVVTHEINNALVPLRTLVEILPARYRDPEFRDWYAEVVLREVDRMQGLVVALGRFRLSSDAELERLDPAVLVREAVELIRPEAQAREIELSLTLEVDPVPAIEVAGEEIVQVLLKLLLDALYAVGACGKVLLRVRSTATHVEVLVEDSGPGDPKAARSTTFDSLGPGSGVWRRGHAVAHGLLRAYGARIEELEHDGPGSACIVRIPIAAPG